MLKLWFCGVASIKIKHTSLDLYHKIYRDDTLIFKQSVTLVFLCKDGKPHRIDEETKEFLRGLVRKHL